MISTQVTSKGEVLRLAGGAGADVKTGDTIVLCPGRLLRDGGESADEDEAFTLVEAAIQDLPAALREIARLRAALDAAAATPTPLATPAPEPADAAPAADAPAPADDAAPAPEPMEAEPTAPAAEPAPEPAADDAHEAEDAPIAVDAVAALAGAADLEAASLTFTEDGKRFALRWQSGVASCVRVEDGAWRVVDTSGTTEARVGRALRLAAALAKAGAAPRSGVSGAVAAFLGGGALENDAVVEYDDDDSAGDFDDDDEAAPGTAMLVEGDLASDGEASCYDDGSDDDEDVPTTPGARYVERLIEGAAQEGVTATSLRWDGASRLVGAVFYGGHRCEVRVDVSATREAVLLRGSYSYVSNRLDGVNWVPVLKLLVAAAAAPDAIARDVGAKRAAAKRAADALAPRAVADSLLHAVATAKTSFAYAGLRRLVEPATLPLVADAAAVDALATARAARDAECLHAVRDAPAFYDSEAGLVYGRVRRSTGPGRWSSSDVAFAAAPAADGSALRLDPTRSWTSDKWDRPLLAPAAVAFAKAAGITAVDVCALRTALLALPDVGAAAADLAFSVIASESGVDAALPRLFAEAAAAGAAPRPGDAYVRALAPVVLDPAAAKTQEDHAAATVADALDGISEDFDEAENEAEEARDNWVKGEDCECRPDRYGYRKWGCPNCGDYHCHDEDCYDPDQIECDCAAENNPLPDPAAFVKDRLEEVDALLARGRAAAAPDDVREALLVGVARGLAPLAPAVPQHQAAVGRGEPLTAAERTEALRSPLSSAERAAVLRAFTELDGKTTQMRLRRSVERILGSPEGFLDAKKAAVKQVCVEELQRLERAVPAFRRAPPFGRGRIPVPARRTPTPFKRALDAAVGSRLSTLTDGATALAKAGRPALLARLLPLRPTAPFAADAIAEAMAVSAGSRSTLVAAVNAAAAKLAARLRNGADFAPARANLRELLARGWLSSWETVKGACDLGALSETTPNGLDLVDFAMEVARHACAPPDALPTTRRAAVSAIEDRLASNTDAVLSSEDLDRALTTLRSIQGEDADAGAAAASRRVLYACAVNGDWHRWAVVCRAALEIDGGAETVNAARGGVETLIKRDIRHGCAVVREGIAKGWLPTDRCISIAAFGNAPTAPRRLALYELALDEATRDGAPAALLESALDAIAAQPPVALDQGNRVEGVNLDALIERLMRLRPSIGVALSLASTSLDDLEARKRAARLLLAHGSDDQLLAFARAESARPSQREVTFVVEAADVGLTLTHASEDNAYGYGTGTKRGAKVVTVSARARAACIMPGMQLVRIARANVTGADKHDQLLASIRQAARPATLAFAWPTPQPDFSARGAYSAAAIEASVAEKGFDVAVRGEYAKLYGDCRAAIPDVHWLHTMLTESDRNCDAALGVLADAYLTAPQNWPRKLASEAEALRVAPLLGSACTTQHSRGDLVLNCRGCMSGLEPGLRAMARLRALTFAGLPDATARPLFDHLAERVIRTVNARVRGKVSGLIRGYKTRSVAGLTPFAPPAPPPGPPPAKRQRVEPVPEEEESQEISIVGVRTAEERDAEAFANAIVIEETQPEPAAEDDSQVMDLTLSQPDA